MTLVLPSCLSHKPTWGFTSRCEEGFYQQEVSLGTTEGLEATAKPAMLSPTWHQCGVPRPHSIGQPSSFPKPPRATSDCPLNPWIHLLLLCTSRRVTHSPKHLPRPQISSALGCSCSLGTVFIYDKYLSWPWAYLFQLTAAPVLRLQMAAGIYPSLMDKKKCLWRPMEMYSPIKSPAPLAAAWTKNTTSIIQAFVIPTAHGSRMCRGRGSEDIKSSFRSLSSLHS